MHRVCVVDPEVFGLRPRVDERLPRSAITSSFITLNDFRVSNELDAAEHQNKGNVVASGPRPVEYWAVHGPERTIEVGDPHAT
jgi:hypothetical protein